MGKHFIYHILLKNINSNKCPICRLNDKNTDDYIDSIKKKLDHSIIDSLAGIITRNGKKALSDIKKEYNSTLDCPICKMLR